MGREKTKKKKFDQHIENHVKRCKQNQKLCLETRRGPETKLHVCRVSDSVSFHLDTQMSCAMMFVSCHCQRLVYI